VGPELLLSGGLDGSILLWFSHPHIRIPLRQGDVSSIQKTDKESLHQQPHMVHLLCALFHSLVRQDALGCPPTDTTWEFWFSKIRVPPGSLNPLRAKHKHLPGLTLFSVDYLCGRLGASTFQVPIQQLGGVDYTRLCDQSGCWRDYFQSHLWIILGLFHCMLCNLQRFICLFCRQELRKNKVNQFESQQDSRRLHRRRRCQFHFHFFDDWMGIFKQ